MGLSGSGINEENHIVSGSWIAWLIDDSIGTILSVPFCLYHFEPQEAVDNRHYRHTTNLHLCRGRSLATHPHNALTLEQEIRFSHNPQLQKKF